MLTVDYERLGVRAGDKVLDLGCGDGFFASLLADRPFRAGLDSDLSVLRRARQMPRVRLACRGQSLGQKRLHRRGRVQGQKPKAGGVGKTVEGFGERDHAWPRGNSS